MRDVKRCHGVPARRAMSLGGKTGAALGARIALAAAGVSIGDSNPLLRSSIRVRARLPDRLEVICRSIRPGGSPPLDAFHRAAVRFPGAGSVRPLVDNRSSRSGLPTDSVAAARVAQPRNGGYDGFSAHDVRFHDSYTRQPPYHIRGIAR